MSNAPIDVESITEDVIEKYQQFVNPTQVALLKVAGFDHIEHTAEGVTITDLDGNIVRQIGLDASLVDVKVCAVTDVWSGLKFVIPVMNRPKFLRPHA